MLVPQTLNDSVTGHVVTQLHHGCSRLIHQELHLKHQNFFNHNSLVTLAFLFKSFNVLHFSLYRHIGPPTGFHSKSFNDGLPLLIKPPNVVCLASKQALLFGFRLLTVIYSCSADWRFRVGEWNKGKQAVISTCKLLHASQTNSVCQKLHELRNGSQTEPCIEQLNPEQKLTL